MLRANPCISKLSDAFYTLHAYESFPKLTDTRYKLKQNAYIPAFININSYMCIQLIYPNPLLYCTASQGGYWPYISVLSTEAGMWFCLLQ